ncbi:MAG: alkaline phosphatase [Candidatus Methylacidiphilales bacterium]|nr:alkaline phosphatase [Candidatus Methylacidiphilales bacterium]
MNRQNHHNGWTRREWVGMGLGTGFLGAFGLAGCSTVPPRARSVIFLVPDGMSAGVPPLAEAFSQRVRQRGTHWHRLVTGGKATLGQFDMASQNSLVTDSAAAASAWGSGRRVMNGVINQFRDGTRLTPLLPLLHERRVATGLVTTARITHATPAGFCASVPQRDQEDLIALEYLRHQPDVLLGGGARHFQPETRKEDGRDLVAEMAALGYTTVVDRVALRTGAATTARRLLGLFQADHLPYTIDHRQDGALLETVPSLSEMTDAALSLLARQDRPFFLMVEGARVDHAAHVNDAAGILWEQLAFDDALGVALAFQERRPDTLIVVGSDHGNANPGLNGMGHGYRESTGCFQRLERATASVVSMLKELRANPSVDVAAVGRVVEAGTGFRLNAVECRAVLDALQQKPLRELDGQQANPPGMLGQILGNWTGIGWTGVTHTSDWTQSLAQGPGQEAFAGLVANTGVFERFAEIYGIAQRNPEDTQAPEITLPAERAIADPTG